MGLSRILGILLVLVGAVVIVAGVALFSVPLATVLAGALVAAFGLSLAIEVRP
jgi:Na+-translocating ferredoxin:NAD+ oxidoreductase RnfA subunit